jgi:hypothetical protein
MKENRGRPKENVEKKMKFTIDYGDSRWHYDLNKHPRGPYLVEQLDTTYDKLEKLYYKLEKLKEPKYHENGRKQRITKDCKKRWNWLRKNIGQNIIDFFQMKDQKEEEENLLNDEEDIELLLEEANGFGLRIEVEQWAIQLLKEDPDLPRIEAYVQAYNEWIK